MIPDAKHPDGVPTPEELRPMYIAIGICPYCKRTMEKRTKSGKDLWYCYGCFSNYYLEEENHDEDGS